jgi:hypothetical protein
VICFVKLYYFSIIFYRIFCIIASKTGVMTQPRKGREELKEYPLTLTLSRKVERGEGK